MHPQVQQHEPGQCPECGMDLVPASQDGDRQDHPTAHDPVAMIIQMRRPWLWTNFSVMIMGLWLVSSPSTFGYTSTTMTWSDIISGMLLMIFAGISIYPHPRTDFWGRWLSCFVGVWLQFAPLLFWAPEAAAYLNDTLIGAFVIALTILVPMMPGMAHHMAMMKPGPEMPPGWSYNPSSWHQRAPLAALGVIGWFISRYLAARQLGHIEWAWEPFFGPGTERVLFSEVSEAFPVSDAGLGAVAYTFEALMAFMGGVTRWRSMPWMVLFFGILVIPLGITHIVLVILMPVMVGHWCTLCLAAAATMLVMIPLTVDEVVAMFQFMAQARREGKPLWRTFWVGDTIERAPETPDLRTPDYDDLSLKHAAAMAWGVTMPWTLLLSIALGLWLMFSPWIFGSEGRAADSDHVVGALVIMIAGIATGEVIRPFRFLNLPLGLWLLVAPWVMNGATTGSTVNSVIAGLALLALSLPRGKVADSYGGWDRYVC
jgi:hypothetical protein